MVSTPSVLFIQLQGKETGYFQTQEWEIKSSEHSKSIMGRCHVQFDRLSLAKDRFGCIWAERFAAATTEGNKYYYHYYHHC